MNTLRAIANWKTNTVIFVVYLILSTIAFPYHANNIRKQTGEITRTLDMRFSYAVEEVEALFLKLKPEGRAEYHFVERVTDIAYPIVYGILMILLITNLTTFLKLKIWWVLFPVLTMIFDFAENATILRLLDQYPTLHTSTVRLASSFSSMKWCFVVFSVSTIIGLSILRFKRKKQTD